MSQELSRNERIKEASNYLRGTLAEGLRQEITGAITEDDAQLVKFHGMYLQDDRDLRPERTRKKMEKAFAFMIRVRVPGGVLTPARWLALDRVARDYGNGTVTYDAVKAMRDVPAIIAGLTLLAVAEHSLRELSPLFERVSELHHRMNPSPRA